jgi:choline dehydrogenase-like flavoprotein/nucleoside-diphosphate-sugar epimerase
MTTYVDFEVMGDENASSLNFDLIIIGSGAAGLTLVRELAGQGIKIAILESGGLQESSQLEELNQVEVSGMLDDEAIQAARLKANGQQLKFWNPARQPFGVRCRVLGGSTAAWAGKVAPFDQVDYELRPWVPASAWPFGPDEMKPYIERAAKHLDLGPLVQGGAFWSRASLREPAQISALQHFGAFFWQFARSRHALTDVMRFGSDFLQENYTDVTVFLNATASCINIEADRVTGVQFISSLSGRRRGVLHANWVIAAAGAIENARLLLLSQDSDGQSLGNAHNVVGRYLMDHPIIHLGDFAEEHHEEAAKLLGFYPIQQGYRAYMYSCGLALKYKTQYARRMPNMAVFSLVSIAIDDPIRAFDRLAKFKSQTPLPDILAVLQNIGLVFTSYGRKLLNYRKIPVRLRRLIADAAVLINANMVAHDYIGQGRGRRIERVSLTLISEQPPNPENRVTLSEKTDRLGLRLAHLHWEVFDNLRRDMIEAARLLKDDLDQAGIKGFRLAPAVEAGDISKLVVLDMAHTAGTTRMGADPASSVVDPALQVHGIKGLHVAGASVFPTSGHANPTLVIVALAVRLADTIKQKMSNSRLEALANSTPETDSSRPLIVVTGATGNIGRALIEQLAARGYRIRGQFRNTIPSDPRVKWVQCDFADLNLSDTALNDLLDGASAVIHLAASTTNVAEMEAANVINLNRLAEASVRAGIRYFGHASSMVVYGSPTMQLVTEDCPRIDLSQPIEKQYFVYHFMREYARSKVLGEDILARHGQSTRVDLYRIAVAQSRDYLDACLRWDAKRACVALYRNSHFISLRNTARAIVHLMEQALDNGLSGVEVYNIADTDSPTFADVYRKAGRKSRLNIPIVFDALQGAKIGRTLARRYPMGGFRLDNSKLKATGFVLEND